MHVKYTELAVLTVELALGKDTNAMWKCNKHFCCGFEFQLEHLSKLPEVKAEAKWKIQCQYLFIYNNNPPTKKKKRKSWLWLTPNHDFFFLGCHEQVLFHFISGASRSSIIIQFILLPHTWRCIFRINQDLWSLLSVLRKMGVSVFLWLSG